MLRKLPDQSYLVSILEYRPDSGAFIWRSRLDCSLSWNKKHAGRQAGTTKGCKGYRTIYIDGTSYRAGRLAWKYVFGVDPDQQIDHKNLNKSDDSIGNLRQCSDAQNSQNHPKWKKKILPKGVHGLNSGRFQARIRVLGITQNLGSFGTPEAAHAAYKCAAEKHFGEFARAV